MRIDGQQSVGWHGMPHTAHLLQCQKTFRGGRNDVDSHGDVSIQVDPKVTT